MSLLPDFPTPPYGTLVPDLVLYQRVWIWDPLRERWYGSVRHKGTLNHDGTTTDGERWVGFSALMPRNYK